METHAHLQNVLGQAKSIARDLGMTGLSAKLEKLERDAEPPRPLPSGVFLTMTKEGDYWTITGDFSTFRLKDSRGLQILARLVEEPGREFVATELAAPSGAIDTGEAGEAIDKAARDAYRRRMRDLQEELDEAESFGDAARAEGVREEIEFLRSELSSALGIGGRPRKCASAIERARSSVGRRLRHAIKRIAEQNAVLGEHLSWAVKTGTCCSYRRR